MDKPLHVIDKSPAIWRVANSQNYGRKILTSALIVSAFNYYKQ